MTRSATAIAAILVAFAAGHAMLAFVGARFAHSPEKEQRAAYEEIQRVRDDAIVLRAAIEAQRIRGEEPDGELSRGDAEKLVQTSLGASRELGGFGEIRLRWVPGAREGDRVWIAEGSVEREAAYSIELRQLANASHETVKVEVTK